MKKPRKIVKTGYRDQFLQIFHIVYMSQQHRDLDLLFGQMNQEDLGMDNRMRIGFLIGMLWFAPSTQAGTRFDEGLWEFAIRYELIGIPQRFPGYETRQCISHQDPVPTISRPGQECVDTLQGRFGRTITWQLNCSTEWEMVQGMGRMHFDGSKASGDVHLQVLNPYNSPQPMLFLVEGKRIGDCKK